MTEKKKISLVVLAAGMGSRYGGLKQMDAFGPNGETIIDYSLFDAHRAGFNHIVFIIRESFAEKFKETFGPKLEGRMEVDYVYQELDNVPLNYTPAPERDRPWGTAHAVWVAHDVIDGPFGIINADDYYGRESYKTLFNFLTTENEKEEYAVVGYNLSNTLSDHGTVNRGVCQADQDGYLIGIEECTKIGRNEDGLISFPGKDGEVRTLAPNAPVSMNMWGFFPSYFNYFEHEFGIFLANFGQEIKSEYYIPKLIDTLIQTGERKTKVLSCEAEWFGVTYREDKDFVSQRLNKLIEAGVYKKDLWTGE